MILPRSATRLIDRDEGKCRKGEGRKEPLMKRDSSVVKMLTSIIVMEVEQPQGYRFRLKIDKITHFNQNVLICSSTSFVKSGLGH